MRNRKVSGWGVLMFVVSLAMLALLFVPLRNPIGEPGRRNSCQSNLQQIVFGIRQYTADYDGKFPLISVSNAPERYSPPYGWADAVMAYTKSSAIYQCPSEPFTPALTSNMSGFSDYWYNGNLSGLRKKAVAYPQSTLLLGEGSMDVDVADARYSKTSLPAAWLTDRTKPPWRHLGGANYLFTDGHVKWLKPNQVLH
ncbi:MAG: DUF1559 domain-containing protein, partial [Armatimonadota bacterium]|nr:DUF1559 domain-containing protein [Armatimonadota bacterium]